MSYSKSKISIIIKPIYRKILGRNTIASALLVQVIYWTTWAAKKGLKEFYKSDQEFADELGVSLRTLQRAKSILKKLNITSTRVAVKNKDNVTYYLLNSARLEELITQVESGLSVRPTRHFDALLNKSATRHFDVDQPATLAVSYIDTEITTEITKRNTSYFQKDFSEKNKQIPIPIRKPEIPIMEEQIILKPEKPVEVKKTYQQALPFSTKEIETVKKTAKSKPTKVNLEEQFSQWYAIYPKHEARKNAYEAFLKAYPKIEFDRLMELTKAYDLSLGSDKKYAKQPAGWLNGERWNDGHLPAYLQAKSATVSATTQEASSPMAATVQQAVEDQNLNKFLEAHQHLDGQFAFSGATMRKIGNEITISHPSQFSLDKIEMHSWKLKEFFKVSKIDFTTETVKKPVQVWPPKQQPYTPPVVEQKPPRYRTLNESYQASGPKTLGANLNALQRSYQQKLQTTG